MVMVGAAVDELEQLAKVMRGCGHRLTDVRGSLTSQLRGTRWTGPDGARFTHEWSATYAPRLAAVSEALVQLSQVLLKQSHEQATASDSGQAASMSRTPGHQPSGWEKVWQSVVDTTDRLSPPFKAKAVYDVLNALVEPGGHPSIDRFVDWIGKNGDRLLVEVNDGITKGFPDISSETITKGLRGVGTALDTMGSVLGLISIADDGKQLVDSINEGGWSADTTFHALDVIGDALQTAPAKETVVPYVAGVAIKEWVDVGREFQKIDWSDPLPPPTLDNLQKIYLPSFEESVIKTFKITWGNL
jgi:hypothetical protein